MKKIISKIGFIFILLLLFCNLNTINSKAILVDEADILTQEEEDYLNKLLDEKGKELDTNLVVYTFESDTYIDDYFHNWYTANHNNTLKGSIIYAINMKARNILICGYGNMDYLRFSDESDIVIDSASFLKTANYKDSIEYFANNISSSKNGYTLKMCLIFGAGNLILAIIIMAAIVCTAGGKVTVNHRNYIDKSKSRIFNNRDIYINTTTTKHKKQSSSSGGSGGSSRGSGGHASF
jgi:uncharacterized membrane protein YgcG